jgi:hypothetical protein
MEEKRGSVRLGRFWIICAAAVAVLSLLGAGCGGGGGEPSASEWADSVCTSIADWRAGLTGLTQFEGVPTKEDIQARIDDAEGATTDLADELRSIGAPSTETGQEAQTQVESLADMLETEVGSIKEEVDELAESSSLQQFIAGLTQLGPRVMAVMTEAQETVDRVRELSPRGELQEAIEDSEACQGLSA